MRVLRKLQTVNFAKETAPYSLLLRTACLQRHTRTAREGSSGVATGRFWKSRRCASVGMCYLASTVLLGRMARRLRAQASCKHCASSSACVCIASSTQLARPATAIRRRAAAAAAAVAAARVCGVLCTGPTSTIHTGPTSTITHLQCSPAFHGCRLLANIPAADHGWAQCKTAAAMLNEAQVHKAVTALLKFVSAAPEKLLEEDELLYLVRGSAAADQLPSISSACGR